jgi:glyoxylase-like metal-dependent hydrolase (beta-lactamase superfamily II)/8-oxo-dGTP pyrophosphatase MutT (NUDIX family)
VPALTPDAPPRAAATVVLLRPGADGAEVLLTLRPATMAFAADRYVFPGGAVDPADADPRLAARSVLSPADAAASLGGDLPGDAALARFVAAIRELFEEAGVLLAEPLPAAVAAAAAREALNAGRSTLVDVAEAFDLRLRTDLLVPISHWTTPPIMARRFDTRFFAAELPAGAEATFPGDEVAEHRWATPRAALEAMAAGDIGMWVPTSATLQQLEHAGAFGELRSHLAHRSVAAPRVIGERPDLHRIVLSGAGGVPGQTVNTYLVGRDEVAIVDPGDPSEEAARAIIDTIAALGGRPARIALTHVDPDHAAGAEGLALRLDIPILAGPGAGRWLPFEVDERADGESIEVAGTTLTVVAAPGPRADHLAFLVGSAVLAGDLVGGRGDRSILGPVDPLAWNASLRRLAAVGPDRVYPGHGDPLGPGALEVRPGATPPGSGGG